MASDRSQVRPSWRPNGPSRSAAASGSGWRRIETASSARPAQGSRPTRLVLGLLGAAATYAAAVWIVLWLRPLTPAGVYLVGAGYQQNLAIPHNTHGLNAMEAVGRLGLTGKARSWFSAADGLGRVRRADDFSSEAFQRNHLGEVPESTVLIYLTGQGGADEAKGSAYVFLDAPDLLRVSEDKLNPTGKLYLKKIIDDIAAVPSKKFLLVLDVTLRRRTCRSG